MIRRILSISILLILLTSCFKEDEPMPSSPLKETTIELTQYYQYQAYFDLGKGEVISSNDRNLWDLGFESKDSAWHVILNTSSFMMAANTGKTNFESVTDTIGLEWKFDKSDGNPDSTAIGKWFSVNENDTTYSNYVYVIDRGISHTGIQRGLIKIIFSEVSMDGYMIKYSELNGDNYQEYYIEKNPEVNYSCFSFENTNGQVQVEPPADDWDLLFTQYTTLLHTNDGEPYPYLLNGVLINYGNVEVVLDTLTSFESIDINYAQTLEYSKNKDAVGYEWKYLEGDPTGGGGFYYKVNPNEDNPNWTYIIKNRNGIYFKLMFTSFYNDSGDKGYPTFAFKVL